MDPVDGLDLVERAFELVRLPSVTGKERAICDHLEARLAALLDPGGEVAASWRLQRVRDNLVVWPERAGSSGGGRSRKVVALVGHLDTVPPRKANPPRLTSDRIYGLGASDMKGGLAVMWHLLAAPIERPRYDLALIFYAREEGPFEGSGLAEVIASCPYLREIDLAICLEPSDNVLQLGCLGSLHAEVTFRGRSAHSARPWHGDNAIHQAGPMLVELAALGPKEVRFGELVYREVISATTARGGTARNVVPDAFVLNINFRFAPGRSLASARERVEQLVAGRAEVRFVDESPAGPIPQQNTVLTSLRERCEVLVAPKQAWTDIARLAAANIDAVNFGPGQSDQAHQPDESASVPHLLQAEQLLRRFLSI